MIADSRSSIKKPASSLRTTDRRRKRQELRREAIDVYRRAILDAAEQVFSSGPFEDVKIAAIARAAGLASGTLYNYFSSKDEMLRSLIELRSDQLNGQLEAVFATDLAPRARLEALVRALLGHVETHIGVYRLYMNVGGKEDMSARRAQHLKHFERAVRDAIVADLLRRDVPAPEQAAYLIGQMHGLIHAWFAAGGKRGLAARAVQVVDFFITGAGARR
jgi:AcrR family transcriptional regulator